MWMFQSEKQPEWVTSNSAESCFPTQIQNIKSLTMQQTDLFGSFRSELTEYDKLTNEAKNDTLKLTS